jgi:hypothetical protein
MMSSVTPSSSPRSAGLNHLGIHLRANGRPSEPACIHIFARSFVTANNEDEVRDERGENEHLNYR